MASTTASATILRIPEGIWVEYLLDFLTARDVARVARTCRFLRHCADTYRNSTAYGRHLALNGLRTLRARVVAAHTERVGKDGLPDLLQLVDEYISRLCDGYHKHPAPADEQKNNRRGARELQISAAVDGRKPAATVQKWGLADIASFLIPVATQLGSDWDESSAAISWGLWALDFHTLRRVLFASKPCDVLAEIAETSEEKAIAHIVSGVFALRGIPAEESEDTDEHARAERAGLYAVTGAAVRCTDAYARDAGGSNPACLEFALAGNALAVVHSLKKVPPRGRYRYLQEIFPPFGGGVLPDTCAASVAMLNQLGHVGPARKATRAALADFRSRLSVLTWPRPEHVMLRDFEWRGRGGQRP